MNRLESAKTRALSLFGQNGAGAVFGACIHSATVNGLEIRRIDPEIESFDAHSAADWIADQAVQIFIESMERFAMPVERPDHGGRTDNQPSMLESS